MRWEHVHVYDVHKCRQTANIDAHEKLKEREKKTLTTKMKLWLVFASSLYVCMPSLRNESADFLADVQVFAIHWDGVRV